MEKFIEIMKLVIQALFRFALAGICYLYLTQTFSKVISNLSETQLHDVRISFLKWNVCGFNGEICNEIKLRFKFYLEIHLYYFNCIVFLLNIHLNYCSNIKITFRLTVAAVCQELFFKSVTYTHHVKLSAFVNILCFDI